jgi:hypothetical protein
MAKAQTPNPVGTALKLLAERTKRLEDRLRNATRQGVFVYVQSEPTLWTVGHYDPQGEWHPESDHDETDKAAARVHWLNGGGDDDEETPDAKTT